MNQLSGLQKLLASGTLLRNLVNCKKLEAVGDLPFRTGYHNQARSLYTYHETGYVTEDREIKSLNFSSEMRHGK